MRPPLPASRFSSLAAALAPAVLAGLACAGSPGLEPVEATPAVDAGSDAAVAALAGRWVALVERDGAKAVATCGHPHTAEIRSDGMGGWEWVLDRGDELRTATIERAEPTASGVRLVVDAGPDQPTELTLAWVEPDRTATFDLAGAEVFVAPAARDAFPAEVCAAQ